MTNDEAANVTEDQFGTTFRNNNQIKSFEEFEFFSGLSKLQSRAFQYCRNLKALTLPSSLTTIGTSSLQYTGLTELTIPESVVEIESGILANTPCVELRFLRMTAPTLGTAGLNGNGNYYVKAGASGYESGKYKECLLDKGWTIHYTL